MNEITLLILECFYSGEIENIQNEQTVIRKIKQNPFQ